LSRTAFSGQQFVIGMEGEDETTTDYLNVTDVGGNGIGIGDFSNVLVSACILGLTRNKNESVTTTNTDGGGVTIEDVKFVTYGILWPAVCALGIIGNVLNLIVLNQPNMKGTAFIYMRGSSAFCNLGKLITKNAFQSQLEAKCHGGSIKYGI
jgi:hypothetical protein